MTMIQYMSDTGLLPGTTHDVSMVAAKLGIHGALQDVKINHPNDLVSLIMFSRPHYSGEPTEVGQFSIPQVPLTQDVDKLTNCPLVSAEYQHVRRAPLGRQRHANAARPRRLQRQHGDGLRLHAGVQPV